MLQDGGFALKEIVAALAPVIDDKGGCVLLGQEMARKIHNALADQRQRLLERQKQMSQTIDDLGRMMDGLGGCFGCTASHSLHDCANCASGPGEVIGLGQRLQLAEARTEAREERKA